MPRQKGHCVPFANPYGMTDEEHSGFDADHRPVLTVPFAYPDDQPETPFGEEDLRLARMEAVFRLLQLLTAKSAPTQIARRVILLSHLAGIPHHQTQRQLAKRLRLTEGRVSQGLKTARSQLAELARDWRAKADTP